MYNVLMVWHIHNVYHKHLFGTKLIILESPTLNAEHRKDDFDIIL